MGRALDEETVARMIERGELQEDELFYQIQEDIEIPPGCNGMSSIVREAQVIGERLTILKQAHLRFSLLSKVSYNSGLDYERYYRDLFNDIQTHRDIWFTKLFNADNPNPTRAEFTVGILGTLCTILRQRGDLKGCMEVMPTYMEVLKRYQQMTEGCGSEPQINCCEVLTFKANIIRINLGVQLGDMKMAVQALRSAFAHEKKEKALGRYDLDGNSPDYDGIFEMFIGHNNYEEVSDAELFNVLNFMSEDRDREGPPLKLRQCGCCDKMETMHGDFKKCSRCHDQPYCSKHCQVKDWMVHKQLCGKKNTTNLPSDCLLAITKQLVLNHSATVDLRTDTPLTEFQKNNAKIALIKKLKQMFTGEFQQFNSPNSASDAASDPAFCAALAEFFAKQAGYKEVWGELCIGYREELERQKLMKRQTKTLSVPDNVIRDYCSDVARTMTIQIGYVLADGDTSEMTNLERHNELVDKLVLLVKKFMRKHTEYDSHAGLRKMASNVEFKAQMGIVISEVWGIDLEE